MATNRRRSNRKNLGQTLNEVDRRLRNVERRPTTSYIDKSLIDTDSLAEESVTVENLSPELSALITLSYTDSDALSNSATGLAQDATDLYGGTSFSQMLTSGRNAVFYQATPPDSMDRLEDDLWYDTDNDFRPYKWTEYEYTITQAVISGTSPTQTAVVTIGSHSLAGTDPIVIDGLTGGSSTLNGSWTIDSVGSTTITLVNISGATNGTYTGLSGLLQASKWADAPFGDMAIANLSVGKLITGTLNVATVATIGDPLASSGSGSSGSIVINGGTGYTGLKMFTPTGVETVFLNAVTGDASFTGTITAASGSIGGWLISPTYLSKGDVGFNAPTSPSGTDVAIWAGDTYANRASAEFKVLYDGSLTASSATITGTINATDGYFGVDSANGWNINSNLIQSKSVSSNQITLDSANAKIYIANGTGSYGSSTTGFYVDSSGLFSLKDKLLFDPGLTNRDGLGTLTIIGRVRGAIDNNVIVPTDQNAVSVTQAVISGTSPNQTIVLSASGHTFLVGDTVIVTGLTGGATNANGAWKITAKDTTTFTYTGVSSATNGTTSQSGSARVRELTLGLHAALNGSPAGMGIRLDEYNYWFVNNQFRVGTAGSYVSWDGTTLTVTGTVNANAGNFTSTVTIGSGSTSGTLTVGTNATATNRITIAGTNTNTTTKIYAGAGNYNNADTPFYFDASGRFSLGASATLSGGSLTITGTVNATGGNFTGYVTAGTLRLGADVNSTNDGIYIDAYNYWYDTNSSAFRVGDSSGSLYWDGSTFYITGASGITTQSTSSSNLGGQLVLAPNSGATDLRFINDRKQIATYAKNLAGTVTLTFSTAHYLYATQWVKIYGLGSPYDGVFSIATPTTTSITYSSGVGGVVASTNAPAGAGVTDEYYGSSPTSTTSLGYGYIGTTQAEYVPFNPPGDIYKTIATVIASPRRYLSSASTATTRSTITMYSTGADVTGEFGPQIDVTARFITIGSKTTNDSATSILGYLSVDNAIIAGDNLTVTGQSDLIGGALVSTRFRLPAVGVSTGATDGDLAFNATDNTIEVGVGSNVKRYLQPVVRGRDNNRAPNATTGLINVPTYYSDLATPINLQGAVVDLLNSTGSIRAQVHGLNVNAAGYIQVRIVNTTTGAAVTTGTYDIMFVAWAS